MNTMDNLRVLLTEEEISVRVKELGKQLTEEYADKKPVVLCMLKGAIYFFSDLTKNIKLPLMLDFARLSSYRNSMVSGKMEMIHDITAKIEGRDVIIVEDIIDSGKTLDYFTKLLRKKNPASIKICAFLDKKERRQVDIEADYVGFVIPDVFVVGYGLDYDEKYRELPFVAEILDPSKA